MHEIVKGLWVGNLEDAAALYAGTAPEPITYLLNLSQFPPAESATPFSIWFPIADEVFLPATLWETLTEFVAAIVSQQFPLLVHCRLGKSRAPSVCAAYLIGSSAYTPDEALATLQACHPAAAPHPETWQSVVAWAAGRGTLAWGG